MYLLFSSSHFSSYTKFCHMPNWISSAVFKQSLYIVYIPAPFSFKVSMSFVVFSFSIVPFLQNSLNIYMYDHEQANLSSNFIQMLHFRSIIYIVSPNQRICSYAIHFDIDILSYRGLLHITYLNF
jgi:hypothetical protein